MSSNIVQLISILTELWGVVGTIFDIVPYAKKKGIVKADLVRVENVAEGVEKVIKEVEPCLPKEAKNVAYIIAYWIPIAAGYAEQIFHAEDIQADQRAEYAENIVLCILKEFKITADNNEKTIINATIKNAVGELVHKTPTQAEQAKQIQLL